MTASSRLSRDRTSSGPLFGGSPTLATLVLCKELVEGGDFGGVEFVASGGFQNFDGGSGGSQDVNHLVALLWSDHGVSGAVGDENVEIV